ncbi:hypothetical protein [Gloeocapsopsis sp. IPPAS B-1203]|nr:hypothetical protein [Gloeocapsopsis sp. IPPAS B-1203]
MLGLNLFEEPRAIREAKDEGRQEAIARFTNPERFCRLVEKRPSF